VSKATPTELTRKISTTEARLVPKLRCRSLLCSQIVGTDPNEDTVRRGIKETLEYLAFLRLNEEYVFGRDDEEYFGSGWNGLLVVQDLQRETASLEEQARARSRFYRPSNLRSSWHRSSSENCDLIVAGREGCYALCVKLILQIEPYTIYNILQAKHN
jgi:hypothetical protein